jgi:hypothetical protein
MNYFDKYIFFIPRANDHNYLVYEHGLTKNLQVLFKHWCLHLFT